MKNNEFSGDFNKIIIDEGDGAQTDNEKAAAAVNADNTAVPAPQPEDNAALQPPDGAQSASDKPASMPPVKPTTIVLTVLFALLFALGYFFLPYLTQYLPVGGQSVTLNAGVVPADHGFLVKNAVSVVIGRSEKTSSPNNTAFIAGITRSSSMMMPECCIPQNSSPRNLRQEKRRSLRKSEPFS